MNKFEIDHFLESKISRKKKKRLICGIGCFDVDFPCGIWIDGKCHHHSAYDVWRHMLQRCYKPNTEQDARIYAGCIVCDEWFYFSNFLAFWKAYYREGFALDKDLLHPGNKTYSPEHCVFIPQALNNFGADHTRARDELPQGVDWFKSRGTYRARIRINGKAKHLGLFSSAQEAHTAWHAARMQQARDWKPVCDEIHPDLHAGLMQKVAGEIKR
ncbi:TPA: hypothetical protein J4786_003203 [Citrobacter amalonaticus]|uniref:hypothetical protein n=1 Tax=Citrobacter amalonaticus TaxID=35703 RepID=UPI001AC23601|nr:hypothetical protein [Citrobacter amalonaticus]HCB3268870.1 hypothetical protein [Citrobacter amalonaticus]